MKFNLIKFKFSAARANIFLSVRVSNFITVIILRKYDLYKTARLIEFYVSTFRTYRRRHFFTLITTPH